MVRFGTIAPNGRTTIYFSYGILDVTDITTDMIMYRTDKAFIFREPLKTAISVPTAIRDKDRRQKRFDSIRRFL